MKKALEIRIFLPFVMALSLILVLAVLKIGVLPTYLIIALGIGVPFVLVCLSRPGFALFTLFFWLFFCFTLDRLTYWQIPVGASVDFLTLVVFGSLLLNYRNLVLKAEGIIKEPVFLFLLLWFSYGLLQVFNPNAHSFHPWLISVKSAILSFLIPYLIFYLYFQSFRDIQRVGLVFFFLCLITALYGFHQEFAGLLPFENKWLFSTPDRFQKILIWGHLRKWSLLSGVASYGMLMAYSAVISLVLSLGPFSKKLKILFFVSGFIMLWAMTFSGTRTAVAMFVAGIAFYCILTLNQKRTIIFGGFSLAIFLFILVAPIQNSTLKRIRSTFEGSEDPSMNVREINRNEIQPYIWSNPMGGGVSTTGAEGLKVAPSHPLAGFPPDNGYLQVALEKGYIGLFFTLLMLGSVLIEGINSYFLMKNEIYKIILAAILSGFFAVVVGNYAQDSITKKPLYLGLIATFVLVKRIYQLEKNSYYNKGL